MTNAVLRTRLLRQPRLINTPIPVAVLGLATLILSILASGPSVLPGDVTVTRWVQHAPAGSVGTLLRIMNVIGETPVMLTIGSILAYLCWRQRRLDAMLLIAAASMARIANPLLKAIFESPRPTADRVQVDVTASGWGFPSGHVMGMTLLVGAVVCLAWDRWPHRLARIATISSATLILLASGAGRIYVAAHWPSDVLGAYLYGGFGAAGLVWCWRHRHELLANLSRQSFATSVFAAPSAIWSRRPTATTLATSMAVVRRRPASSLTLASLLTGLVVIASLAI